MPSPVAEFSQISRGGLVASGTVPSVAYEPSIPNGGPGFAPAAYDGTNVWTVGFIGAFPHSHFWVARLTTDPPAVGASNAAAVVPGSPSQFVAPAALVFEPSTAKLWFTDNANALVVRLDTAGLSADETVSLVISSQTYIPTGMVAVGGKLYVAATTGLGAGRLFEIDPVSMTVTRTSTGAGIPNAFGVDYDPGSQQFIVTGHSGGAPRIARVDRSTFAETIIRTSSSAGLEGAPAIGKLYWATVAYGSIWASSDAQMLWRFDLSGNAQSWFQPASPDNTISGGNAVSDGLGFLWFGDGIETLYLLSPTDSGFPMTPVTSVPSTFASWALTFVRGQAPALVP